MPPTDSNSDLDYDAIRCLGAPLEKKLSMMASWSAVNYPEFRKLYDELVERLIASGATSNALATGSTLPSFMLPSSNGRFQNLQDLLARGPLVVSFNRGYWCPYCRLELQALEEIYADVKRMGGMIVSITPQTASSAKKLQKEAGITFPILCDIDNFYALDCGLMMSIGEAVDQAYKDFGFDLAADQGNSGFFLPMPATYVANHAGRITAACIHPDFRTRMAPQDILSALQLITS